MLFRSENLRKSLEGDFSNATEIADYLVKKGFSFREAHQVVGKIVLYCIDQKKKLDNLTLEEFLQFHNLFAEDILTLLIPEEVVNSKKSSGGTALEIVRKTIIEAENIIKQGKIE